jgi:hypothetical protein
MQVRNRLIRKFTRSPHRDRQQKEKNVPRFLIQGILPEGLATETGASS